MSMLKLAEEFDKKLKKEAWIQAALGILGVAWITSSMADLGRRSQAEFASTKAGVQKAVNLASQLKVKKNQEVINRFVQKGKVIIPLFDIMQNIANSEPSQELINQLDSFIRNVSDFINEASIVEQVIKENSTWYERIGYLIEDQLGMGFSISSLKSFGYLIPQLIPSLSIALSNASAAYNSFMAAVDKAKQNGQVGPAEVTQEAAKPVVGPKATTQSNSVNTLFEDFANIWS